MVSALASSSVTLPRNVSVKVLVSDWDLLCGKSNSDLVVVWKQSSDVVLSAKRKWEKSDLLPFKVKYLRINKRFIFHCIITKVIVELQSYFSCGDCFWAPGPDEAGMGPGWKAWLGEVVADRARWGEPWADWEGEAVLERCPPVGHTHKHTSALWTQHSHIEWCNNEERVSYLVGAVMSVKRNIKRVIWTWSITTWYITEYCSSVCVWIQCQTLNE